MTCISAARTTANAMMYLWGSPRDTETASVTRLLPVGAGPRMRLRGSATRRGRRVAPARAPRLERVLEGGDDGSLDVVDRSEPATNERRDLAGVTDVVRQRLHPAPT